MSVSNPKVSVLMITYNHERYIEQAVRSVMMQETSFDYELIIGEDCSTDRTREIVIRLHEEFPDKIKLILQPQNVGMIRNFADVYHSSQGEYIALLEGDDYWVSSNKLQLQADYMRVHPKCRICFHSSNIIYEGNTELSTSVIAPPLGHIVNFENWLRYRSRFHTYIATATIFFRSINNKLPEWFFQLRAAGDWPLIAWLLLHGGTVGYLSGATPMSVYRKHTGGVTYAASLRGDSRKREKLLDDLADHYLVRQNLTGIKRNWLVFRFYNIYLSLANEYLITNNPKEAKKNLIRAVYFMPALSPGLFIKLFQIWMLCHGVRFHRKGFSFIGKGSVD